jgi:hypothetical protein
LRFTRTGLGSLVDFRIAVQENFTASSRLDPLEAKDFVEELQRQAGLGR